jgi:hypothetical protein
MLPPPQQSVRSVVLCRKVILKKSLPKVLDARPNDGARKLAQEIEPIEHQEIDTPVDALFALDEEEDRRHLSNVLAASATTIAHSPVVIPPNEKA